MKTLEQALEELKDLVDIKIKEYKLPYRDGRVTRIDKFLIRPSKKLGYIIIDTETNKSVSTMFSKVAAVAAAKALLENKSLKNVIHYDNIIEKNFNDSKFYFNIIETTNDSTKKDIMNLRLEISQEKIDSAKHHLDRFILEDIR